jgi:hypothetical protein
VIDDVAKEFLASPARTELVAAQNTIELFSNQPFGNRNHAMNHREKPDQPVF